jgi:hypothetical protein
MKDKINLICITVLLFNFAIFSVLLLSHANTNSLSDLKCITENVTQKQLPSGSIAISKLTTLFFLHNSTITVINKGAIADQNKLYMVDRTMHFSIKSVGNSNIYHASTKKIEIAASDNVPTRLFENIELDGFDYFYVTNALNNAYIFHGLVLPIATCSML